MSKTMKLLLLSHQDVKYMSLTKNYGLHHSSFPVIHKVGNVDIFALPKFENMTEKFYYIN